VSILQQTYTKNWLHSGCARPKNWPAGS